MIVLKLSILFLCLLILILLNNRILAQGSQTIPYVVMILNGSSDPAAPIAFSPTSLSIPAGQSVNWSNSDKVFHTVTSISQNFDSGIIEPGNAFAWTFDKAGYYKYYCQLHPFMNGVIIVS